MILPKQAGVALGLLAFAVASITGVFSGVSVEVIILRGVISFLVFLILGSLAAYLVYDDEKPDMQESDQEIIFEEKKIEKVTQPLQETTDNAADIKNEPVEDTELGNLKPPDDTDF